MSSEGENSEQIADSNKISESEIQNKLKGDAIGDTAYTQRFVLKTLLKLKELEWNEELEDDLCFLWDSTVEKDVCNYLMDVNFPSIACSLILEYNTMGNGRLTEILVGIVANIITAKCEKQLENDQIDIIYNLLVSTDSLVLIQVMRFIIALCHDSERLQFFSNDKSADLVKHTEFILKSSINFELIQKTLEALSRMTTNSKLTLFFDSEMFEIAIYACVRTLTEDEEKDFELFSREQRSCVKYLVQYILNFCVFINQTNTVLGDIENSSNTYINFFCKLCEWYCNQENLLPITDELLFYFEATNYIFFSLKVDYDSNLLKKLFSIIKILMDNECEDISEIIEMCCYFIHKGKSEQVKADLSTILHSCQIEQICTFLGKQNLNFHFEREKLTNIY